MIYLKASGKKKGKRIRKSKTDKTDLFKSLEFKIGIEKEEFDASYDDFMKTCPKVKDGNKCQSQYGKMENIALYAKL